MSDQPTGGFKLTKTALQEEEDSGGGCHWLLLSQENNRDNDDDTWRRNFAFLLTEGRRCRRLEDFPSSILYDPTCKLFLVKNLVIMVRVSVEYKANSFLGGDWFFFLVENCPHPPNL